MGESSKHNIVQFKIELSSEQNTGNQFFENNILPLIRQIPTVAGFIIAYTFLSTLPTQASVKPLKTKILAQTPVKPGNIPGSIVIRRFEIIGNQVIPQAEIDRALQPYLFRPISFTELFEVQQTLTKLYVQRGYFTSGAYIPPQTISDRTVKIEIIKGKNKNIRFEQATARVYPQPYCRRHSTPFKSG